MTNAVAAWYGKEPDIAIDRVASQYVQMFLYGIGMRGLRQPSTARAATPVMPRRAT